MSTYGEVGLADLFAPLPTIHWPPHGMRLVRFDGGSIYREERVMQQRRIAVDRKEKSVPQERVIPIETHVREFQLWTYGAPLIQEPK